MCDNFLRPHQKTKTLHSGKEKSRSRQQDLLKGVKTHGRDQGEEIAIYLMWLQHKKNREKRANRDRKIRLGTECRERQS